MTIYLSRLFLENQQRTVRHDLGDSSQLHRTILKAFGNAPVGVPARDHFGVLFRIETIPDTSNLTRLLVQSTVLPDWSHLPSGYLGQSPLSAANPSVRMLDHEYAAIQDGMVLIFRLRANPTKRISNRNPDRPDPLLGKRVELLREDDQIAWLVRKGEQHGFQILATETSSDVPDVRVTQAEKAHGTRRNQPRTTFGTVVFNGRLTVTHRELFIQSLVDGIGSGKSFGFGLLSIAAG